MALISMCIQVMQDNIVSSVRWVARTAGIIPEENARPRARIRRTAPGTVGAGLFCVAPKPTVATPAKTLLRRQLACNFHLVNVFRVFF